MHLEAGHILNKNCYQIKKVIGQGGFGITYLADEIGYFRSTGFGDTMYVKSQKPDQVVIKELFYGEYCKRDVDTGLISVINPEKRLEFEKLVQNQLDEGKKLRALSHPNIVRTRDIFKENETAYMVIDFVDGTDLEEILLRESKVSLEKALKYTIQILSALSHIHERNQVHLDIKPSNVLIKKETDEAILIDFGASQSYDHSGKIKGRTSQLVVAMTKHYAPNEQGDIDNLKHFDATFDTYATGATLYHMLTGEKPPLSSLLSTGRDRLKLITSFPGHEKTTDFMDSIVNKALAPMYNARFKSAKEFEVLLRKYPKYILMLNEVKSRLLGGIDLGAVLKYIEEAEKEFLPTDTLLKLKKAIRDKQERESGNRGFELNSQNANYFFEQKNYVEALKYLSLVAQDQPGNESIAKKIKFCKEQIANAKNDDSQETLLLQAKKDVSKGNLFSAKYKLEQLIVEDSENAEATVLLKKVRNDIESEAEGTLLVNKWDTKDDDDKTVLTDNTSTTGPLVADKKNKKVRDNKKVATRLKQLIKQNEKWIKYTIPLIIMSIVAIVLITKYSNNKKSESLTEVFKDSVNSLLTQDSTTLDDKVLKMNEVDPKEEKKQAEQAQIEEVKVEAANKQVQKTSEDVKDKTQTEKGKINLGGHSYSGDLKNGKPNGSGTLTFSFGTQVDENDPKENMAEKGDYLKGRWNDGKLEFGTLFSSSGEKKVTIVIGRF